VVSAWISAQTRSQGEVRPQADNNWRLAPVQSNVPLDIRFETSPSEKAAYFIARYGVWPMRYLQQDENGFAIYRLDLQNKK